MRNKFLALLVFLTALTLCLALCGAPAWAFTTTPQMAAGPSHTLALKSDGTVWAWGRNDEGQLGDDPTTIAESYIPVQVQGLAGVTAIAAGWDYCLALKSDGTVWAWGRNDRGQLGNGSITDRSTPVQVGGGLANVTAIAAGREHSLALKSDGTVWAWGSKSSGQLGDGTSGVFAYESTPVQVLGLGGVGFLTDVTAIAAGQYRSLALKIDGTVWAWGDNDGGQLGDGFNTRRSTPVQVLDLGGVGFLTGITAITAGGRHSLALKSDGTVLAWGWNNWGQLGDGTTTERRTPVSVLGLSGVTAIAAGWGHSLALESGGTVRAWGINYEGQLGDGTTTERHIPVSVQGLTGVTAITSGAGSGHSFALKSDGTVWAWGENSYGQLGDGTTTDSSTPAQVPGFNAVVPVETSSSSSSGCNAMAANAGLAMFGLLALLLARRK